MFGLGMYRNIICPVGTVGLLGVGGLDIFSSKTRSLSLKARGINVCFQKSNYIIIIICMLLEGIFLSRIPKEEAFLSSPKGRAVQLLCEFGRVERSFLHCSGKGGVTGISSALNR